MDTDPGTGRLRADAQRNREQIIEAAAALFAERGPDVPMEEIARRAGVGVGTLYRRFPERNALVRAVALDGYRRVVAQARDAIEAPRAWDGLTGFVRRSLDELRLAAALSTWFARTWATITLSQEHRQLRAQLLEIMDRLVERAQAEGAMRPDVGTGDVALLLALVLRPLPGPLTSITQRCGDRYVALVFDGLRAGTGERLPGQAITATDLGDPG